MRVLIRGAGEMASGVAYRLAHSGFHVLITEISTPLAVRRAVCFSEAVYDGSKIVEGRTARLIQNPEEASELWAKSELPVLVDPDMTCRAALRPMVIVDALLAKRNTGLHKTMAPLTIGLGPGFHVPDEVDLAVETNRGHNLGRLISLGSPEPNTGVPGKIAGYTSQRVLRAPADGTFESDLALGDRVRAGQVVASVKGQTITAQVDGVLRGLLRPGARVNQGTKVGDVDPRGQLEYLHTISEKARAVGGSVLEGIMATFNR
ncbi:MAG: EF2563 family selenium-dependent molybdenum hydroxylase system protein [Deltaproteobacteria bacterium]|nr:EF2563 family selenium-dependent molybdenum hydroxylase system protein [Deltaproteobacteria bacterium]